MADNSDQFEIIQEIFEQAAAVPDDPWREIMIKYHTEPGRCNYTNTYLVERNGEVKEESLRNLRPLYTLMGRLQKALTQSGQQVFTHCRIHFRHSGKYDIQYGYEPVDWDALLIPEWNFFPSKKK